jgi:[ribosomal protein S18]-alanine N-acetyltransferase
MGMNFFTDLFAKTPPAIDRARMNDASALAAIHGISFARGWGEGEFERMLSERNTLAHAVRRGRAVIGFIISRIGGDEAEILSVALAPAERGRGIARDLLMIHLGYLAGLGVRTVFLEVEEANAAARALYRRAGFADVGRREGYYAANGAAAIVMRRDIV